MSVELAHEVMQNHINCSLPCCARKRQAKKLLVDTGRLTPADVPHMGFR
ncbi:hypothetical protein IU500_33955 [Nocardia terpenica]|nr:hypothetical protein [Nocardia terpenica]MBF6066052.1 hypothetical protein [Nocardia terpenica]MBF6109021.1 hypothetical protein [Nocardia terpenica]MBF6116296.1 hypothetical protein [Nocardia terpenica]MBF6123297.1 hypothetical protein [Nocardia terpenica]MBF6156520.1 hypothetical protein [Nocardia terpenica]